MNNTDLKSRLNTYAHNAEKALGGYLKESTEDYKVLIEAMRYSLLGGRKEYKSCPLSGILPNLRKRRKNRPALCLCGGNGARILPDTRRSALYGQR